MVRADSFHYPRFRSISFNEKSFFQLFNLERRVALLFKTIFYRLSILDLQQITRRQTDDEREKGMRNETRKFRSKLRPPGSPVVTIDAEYPSLQSNTILMKMLCSARQQSSFVVVLMPNSFGRIEII